MLGDNRQWKISLNPRRGRVSGRGLSGLNFAQNNDRPSFSKISSAVLAMPPLQTD
jgi:hypothetical protein